MPRPPLPLNTAGSMTATEVRPGVWRARCRYRRGDGQTIPLERTKRGKTGAAALRALNEAVRDLQPGAGEVTELRPHHTVEHAARLWMTKLETAADDEEIARTTVDHYRKIADGVVVPALGRLRIGECTAGRMDTFFTDDLGKRLAAQSGQRLSAAYRRDVRTVVKQILAQAVLHGALSANPIHDIRPIKSARRRKQPRALTPEERSRIFDWLATPRDDPSSEKARQAAVLRDLPDFLTAMFGTGPRIGEMLAVRWLDVDLDGVPIVGADGRMFAQPIMMVTGNVVHVRGRGLVRNPGKTESALRVVPLPRFVADMLRARRPDAADPEWPVFPTVSSGRGGLARGQLTYRSPNTLMSAILEMRRAMGIDWKLTSHTFRKTAATIWADAGTLTDRQAADLMGHARFMKDIYVGRGELHPEGAAVMDAAWRNS